MAYPSVESITETAFPSKSTTHNVAMPSTVSVGDLLLILFGLGGSSVDDTLTTPDGWDVLFSTPTGTSTAYGPFAGYIKISDGTEGGTTVNVASSGTLEASSQVYRISGWYGDLAGIEAGGEQHSGGSSNPNPLPYTASWGARENLWIAAFAAVDDGEDINTAPTDFTDELATIADGGLNNSITIGSARREYSTTADLDPGNFNITGSEAYGAVTIVVRPALPTMNNTATITIDSDQVEGTSNHTDFSVLIKGTYAGSGNDPDLRTVANGGDIENTTTGSVSGSLTIPADLFFTSDADGALALDHEMVDYDASTGDFIAWVRVPDLDYDNDTVIYLQYGNSSVTTSQENINAVWRDEYKGVWHLTQTSGTRYDSTSNGNDLTDNNTVGQDTGKILNGADFDGADYLNISNAAQTGLNPADNVITVSAWANFDTVSGVQSVLNKYHNYGAFYDDAYLLTTVDTKMYFRVRNASDTGKITNGNTTLSQNVWYLHHGRFDGPSEELSIFLNGNSDATPIATGAFTVVEPDSYFSVGVSRSGVAPTNPTAYTNGTIEEARVYMGVLTDGWIKTEYNNQNSPSTFYSIEEGLGSSTTTQTIEAKGNILANSSQNMEAKGRIQTGSNQTINALGRIKEQHSQTITAQANIKSSDEGRLWSSGFELKTIADDQAVDHINGTAEISTSIKRSGTASLRVNPTSGEGWGQQGSTEGETSELYFRIYVYIASAPSTISDIMLIYGALGGAALIRLNTDLTLELWEGTNGTTQIGSDSPPLELNKWYRIELGITDSSTATWEFEGRLDGVVFASGSYTMSHSGYSMETDFGFIPWLTESTTGDMYIDDVAVNTNRYPGEGKIIHLLPSGVGDNSDWIGDWTDIDEVPPDDTTTVISSNTLNEIEDVIIDGDLNSIGTVKLVQIGARFAGESSSNNSSYVLRAKKEPSGTVAESNEIPALGTAWVSNSGIDPRNYQLTLPRDPDNQEWTKESLATSQIGVRTYNTDTNHVLVSSLWMLVEYVAAPQQTIEAKGNIEATQQQKNAEIEAAARIEVFQEKGVEAKGRIEQASTQTTSALGNIRQTYSQSIQANSRIVSFSTQNIEAKGSISESQIQNTEAKGRIENSFDKSITAKARIQTTYEQTISSKGRIDVFKAKNIEAKGRIEIFSQQSLESKGNIKTTQQETISALARIGFIPTQYIQTKARIEATSTQSTNAKGSILLSNEENINSKARVQTLEIQTINAKARIGGGGATDIEAKANIKKSNQKDTSSKASILTQISQEIEAKGKILIPHTQQIQAKALIAAPTAKTIQVKGNIFKTSEKTINAVGKIELAFAQTISAKALVVKTHTQTLTSKARIAKIEVVEIIDVVRSQKIVREVTYIKVMAVEINIRVIKRTKWCTAKAKII